MTVRRVIWITEKLLTGQGGRRPFGICGHTKRIFTIAKSDLSPIIITDVVVDFTPASGNLSCEEAKRCLNIKCPMNHSSPENLSGYFGIKGEDFAKLPIEDQWPGLAEKIEDLCEKFPAGGMVYRKF
jgi:hypothetical protein